MPAGAPQVAERDGGPGTVAAPVGTEPEEGRLSAALLLGWRIAELYAQVDDTGEPLNDTLLPAHQSLAPEDQLELQLRAAAGDARRVGLASQGAALERLVQYARGAPSSPQKAELFRRQVRSRHVELDKELWARDEAAGKAYELGNGMSDTYGRIRRAYAGSQKERESAWAQVFDTGRIERLKKLLDDLQSRLNPSGVTVVRHHLDVWRDSVPARIRERGGPPPSENVRDGLRRQTVIWRQLIAGDKEPEAYLDSDARAELRGELRALVWKRFSRWIAPTALVLFALVFFLPQILSWYRDSVLGTGIASAVVAVAGAVGITRASVLLSARTQLHRWSELLWNRALARKVSDKTLVLDATLPPVVAQPASLVDAAAAVGKSVRASILPARGHARRPRPSG
jgi:hypothetical protein